MNDGLITNESCKLGSLTRCTNGWYNEFIIVNGCKENVVVVDRLGNKTVVPSAAVNGAYDNTISILKRSSVGPSIDPEGRELQLQGSITKIRKHMLRNNPVFIDCMDVLLCTEDQALNAMHPYATLSYTDALETSLEQMPDRIDMAPGFKLMANDPTGSFDQLYTLIDTEIVEIPVTHEADDNFVLSILLYRDGQVYTEHLDLSALLKGTENTVKFNERIIPWVTTNKIAAMDMAKSFRWISPDIYKELEAKLQSQCKLTIDQAKSLSDARINDLTAQMTNLKSQLTQTSTERDEYKSKYTALKADQQVQVDRLQQQAVITKTNNDSQISENSLQQAMFKMQSAEKENQFKVAGLIMAAALPVVGLLAMEMFKHAMKK